MSEKYPRPFLKPLVEELDLTEEALRRAMREEMERALRRKEEFEDFFAARDAGLPLMQEYVERLRKESPRPSLFARLFLYLGLQLHRLRRWCDNHPLNRNRK